MIAHQGGWDEMLLVAAPLLVLYLILRLVKRRADAVSSGAATQADPHN